MNVRDFRTSGARDPERRIQMAPVFSGVWRGNGAIKIMKKELPRSERRRFGGACRSKQYFELNTMQSRSSDGNDKPAQALDTGNGGIARYVSLQKPFPPSFSDVIEIRWSPAVSRSGSWFRSRSRVGGKDTKPDRKYIYVYQSTGEASLIKVAVSRLDPALGFSIDART